MGTTLNHYDMASGLLLHTGCERAGERKAGNSYSCLVATTWQAPVVDVRHVLSFKNLEV